MKRIFFLWLMALTVTLAGCSDPIDELQEWLDDIDSSTNLTMGITQWEDDELTLERIVKLDGSKSHNIMHIHGNCINLCYYEMVFVDNDDEHVIYTRTDEDDAFDRVVLPREPEPVDDLFLFEFEAAWFTYEDGRYELKEAHFEDAFGDEADMVISMVVTIESGAMTFTLVADVEGVNTVGEIVYSEIGSTVVEEPQTDEE